MFLGIDVGSISMKFVLFLKEGEAGPPPEVRDAFFSPEPVPLGTAGTGYLLSYDRLLGDPMRKVPERFRQWIGILGEGNVSGVSITGKSGRQLAPLVGGEYENDFRCLVKAVTAAHPEVRTIFEMGGENAKVVRLEPAGREAALTIRDYDTNGDCAAGTGSFIDQQAHRMKIEVETIGEMVGQAASAARIAGRCSVFAKTDMIHAQQKGYSPEEILKGLCEAVARNFKSNINKGKDPVPVVALVGGLFANSGVVRAVRDVFGFEENMTVRPAGFAHMSAFGAAMAAAEAGREWADPLACAARPGGRRRGSSRSPPGPPFPRRTSCSFATGTSLPRRSPAGPRFSWASTSDRSRRTSSCSTGRGTCSRRSTSAPRGGPCRW